MIDSKFIEQLVDAEARKLADEHPNHSDTLIRLAFRFKSRFRNIELDKAVQIFELCENIDEKLEFDDEVSGIVSSARMRISDKLIEQLYLESTTKLRLGDIEQSVSLNTDRDLSKSIARLISVVKKLNPVSFSQKWIQLNAPELFTQINELIKSPETGVRDWDKVSELLPISIRDKFVIEQTVSREKLLVDAIGNYQSIAKNFGVDALAQFLISIGKADGKNFAKVKKIIVEYLGRFESPKFIDFSDVMSAPESLLQITDVRRLMFLQIRNHVYRELVRDGFEDKPVASYSAKFENIRRKIHKLLSAKMNLNLNVHRELLEEVIVYFEEVLSFKAPDRMVSTIEDREGVAHFFPSLRQRIAMKEIKDDRRKLIAFFMSNGKTGSAFLSFEHVQAKKMLFICPPGHLVEEMASRVKKYYKTGMERTVGIIKSGIKPDEMKTVLDSEIVIMPYSMLGSKIEDKKIVDMIKEYPFDFLTVDEIQWARNDRGLYTQSIYDLATGIPGLYESGYIALLSGDPTPNSPDDIVPQLRIYNKEDYNDSHSLRQVVNSTHPIVVRNAIIDFVLLLDDPEDWEQYVNIEDFDLFPEERRIYLSILENEMLEPGQKLKLLSLCVVNPSLYSDDQNEVRSALFEGIASKTREYLRDYNCVIIADNESKQGFSRLHKGHDESKSFYDRLRAEFGEEVLIFVHDGETSESDRKDILEASKNPNQKVIIVAMSKTLREGIDLSHINRAILLEPSYNKADTAQFVKRFARNGNSDVEISIFQGNDTIQQGIGEHASQKYELTQLLKHGGALTDDDLGFLESDVLSDAIRVEGRKLYIGTAIMSHLLSSRHKLHRFFAHLHNKGAEYCRRFFEEYGKFFTDLYMENWEGSYSANNGRLVASIVENLENEGLLNGDLYLDIASGPLVLHNSLISRGGSKKRRIYSLDLNEEMLEAGREMALAQDPDTKPYVKKVDMTDMSGFQNEMFDLANCALAINYTRLNTRIVNNVKDERVQALLELQRVLKKDGIGILTLSSNCCDELQFNSFTEALEKHFGFEVVKKYTGQGYSINDETDNHFQNYTIVLKKVGKPNITDLNLYDIKMSRVKTVTSANGNPTKDAKLSGCGNSCIHDLFQINDVVLDGDSN